MKELLEETINKWADEWDSEGRYSMYWDESVDDLIKRILKVLK